MIIMTCNLQQAIINILWTSHALVSFHIKQGDMGQ